jgi:hypothetical protein
MAFRIDREVVRGELDNTLRGTVRGRIWLLGRDAPLELELQGDCWRDLAGRRCTFVNPHPEPGRADVLHTEQRGQAGDITVSRKVRIIEGPVEEWYGQRKLGLHPPEHLANSVYLEWYSERNGRVVIESADFQIEVSLPEWTQTEEEEQAQQARNAEAWEGFLVRISDAIGPRQPVEVPEDRDMDEFEWERFLKASDARTAKYGELLEKYADHPDRDRIVERAMGWDRREHAGDEDDFEDVAMANDLDDDVEPPLDPAREGIDWVRTESGRPSHPLVVRCSNLGLRMHFDVRDAPGELAADEDVEEMVFRVHSAATKMAGVLHAVVGNSPHLEPGFVVAGLKRALHILNLGIAAHVRVASRNLLPEQSASYREELFAIRDEMLRLMDRFRRDINR